MIPSNTTNKEFARYYIATAERSDIQNRFEELMEELEELKRNQAFFDKTEEVLREQLGFARDLVTNLQEQANISYKEARKNSREWNLANFVICEIEDSYFEL